MKSSNTPRAKKKAVLYPRVSTHKQKVVGYSFEDQENRMLTYCKAFGLEADERVFREDYSAKTFKKRKVFQELLKYLKENKKDIDCLLFTKIDRFSRKRDESLEMKRKIEGWGIRVIGIEEPDVADGPSKLLIESILHTLPEVDNMIRSESVKRGMRAAKRQGRFVAKPPFGYIRIPPKSKLEKSKLTIDKEKAPLVKEVFNRVISGEPVSIIRKSMESKGLNLKKTQVYSMIKNFAYMGKIRIDAWKEKNEPETVVIALHPAIVSEIIFWAAQNALKKKRITVLPTRKEKYVLKELLICPKCGKSLRASTPRSRSGQYYDYYHCRNRCIPWIRADKVEKHLEKELSKMKIKSEAIDLFNQMLNEHIRENKEVSEKELISINREIEQLNNDLTEAGMEHFIRKNMEADTHAGIKNKLDSEKAHLYDKKLYLERMIDSNLDYVKLNGTLISNILFYYNKADINLKKQILGSIISQKLVFDENDFRTFKYNSVLELLFSNREYKWTLKKEQNDSQNPESDLVHPAGIEPATC